MEDEDVFSFRLPSALAEDVRKYARKRYGQKSGSIKKFVIDAFKNEIKLAKEEETEE